jgi:hypothetical protein
VLVVTILALEVLLPKPSPASLPLFSSPDLPPVASRKVVPVVAWLLVLVKATLDPVGVSVDVNAVVLMVVEAVGVSAMPFLVVDVAAVVVVGNVSAAVDIVVHDAITDVVLVAVDDVVNV